MFSGEIPRTPLTRRGIPPLSCSPPTRAFGPRGTSGVQWPYHFSKTDDGPVLVSEAKRYWSQRQRDIRKPTTALYWSQRQRDIGRRGKEILVGEAKRYLSQRKRDIGRGKEILVAEAKRYRSQRQRYWS